MQVKGFFCAAAPGCVVTALSLRTLGTCFQLNRVVRWGMFQCMQDVEIQKDYAPGAIGRVVELHGAYYHENWGFGVFFEAKVARELAGFMARYDKRQDGFWTATNENGVQGSIAIDGIHGNQEGAHLRWFIVSDVFRGLGVGRRLLHTAIEFCRTNGYRRIYLWTFEGLDQARHLYEAAGFELTEQHRGKQWGKSVIEQRFERVM